MYYIGIDLGTSAVKLLLMEDSGKICNIVSKEYPLFFPHPGWSEQKPEDWFAQSMEGIFYALLGCQSHDQGQGRGRNGGYLGPQQEAHPDAHACRGDPAPSSPSPAAVLDLRHRQGPVGGTRFPRQSCLDVGGIRPVKIKDLLPRPSGL